MLFIYEDERIWRTLLDENDPAKIERYQNVAKRAAESGWFVESAEFKLPEQGTKTVQVRDGKRFTNSAPFAATKEQIAGFLYLDCPTIDDALSIAAELPGAEYGSVEVRPIEESTVE
jgi:hypothetical protein